MENTECISLICKENKYRELFNYLNKLTTKEMNLLNIMCRIHFVLNHQIVTETDDNHDDNVSNFRIIRSRETIGNARRSNNGQAKFSKFVNEVIVYVDVDGDGVSDVDIGHGAKGGLSDFIWDKLVEIGVTREFATVFVNYLYEQDYDSDAIEQDIIDCDVNDLSLTYKGSFI